MDVTLLGSGSESMLKEILTRIVSLECRLEDAGVLKSGERECDRELLFALEHGIPLERLGREQYAISEEFIARVDDWMEKHEDDPDARYAKLAIDLSDDGSFKSRETELLIVLRFFARTGRWGTALQRVTSDPHPSALKSIREIIEEH